MRQELYPLKFETIFKDKIWGGNKIKEVLGKDYGSLPNCGETWEISGVNGNVSVVSEGPLKGKDLQSLIKEYKGELLGNPIFERFGDEFPLLVKFIDANDDLSIQVHPDDVLGMERHNSKGKTEMWYVMQADKDAKLIAGFNKPVSKEEYLESLENGKLMDILNEENVYDGDVFFLPAGRVHSIGKGILVAEIQQTSDITYRIYDFDRTDDEGNKRELHNDQAVDAIDFGFYEEYKTPYEQKKNETVGLVSCPYFTTNKLSFSEPVALDYQQLESFVIYVCLDGSMAIKTGNGEVSLQKGECLLLPANTNEVELTPTSEEFTILESYIA
ncbi:mannose-6-phosphate isomerase [Fulvitalea axinellae]|uniref:Phosphohexomutase n=1 Tax=Fulvitalea axinellae TaxID=1182444 RepID=A0AAU9CP41_9BACT|nr:mannose-6-phosphate isomerase [Fulvitalea axinellae]